MRKTLSLLFSLATLFTTSSALAVQNDVSLPDEMYSGISQGYAGFLLGGDRETFKLNVQTTPSVTTSPVLSQNFNLSDSSPVAGLTLGYGMTYQRFYSGIEASSAPLLMDATLNRADAFAGVPVRDELRSNNVLNLDWIPGFWFTPCFLTYGRLGLGANTNRFQQSYNGNSEFHDKYISAGLRLGVGADWRIAQHFGLGADYIYSRYNGTDINDTSLYDGLQKQISVGTQIHNLVAAHLRYYF